jgi:MFS family permease
VPLGTHVREIIERLVASACGCGKPGIVKRRILYGLADALDRVGATLVTLCLLGGWFTEQFTWARALGGIGFGILFVVLGVYTKAILSKENADGR